MRQVFRECPDCRVVKPLCDFGQGTRRRNGAVKKFHKPWCRKCESQRVMASRAKRDPHEVYLAQKSWAERKYGSRENDPARIAYRDRDRVRRGRLTADQRADLRVRSHLERQSDRLAERNARQAFDYWFNVRATDEQIAAWFAALGTPWKNPRLTDAEQYRLRYQIDQKFAERERARASERRFLNPEIAAQWAKNGTRWYRALQSDDGSIDRETLRYLRTIPECAYCGDLISDDRHYDHVTALALGGRHSADNLIPAHGACNLRKSAKPLLPFMFPTVFTPEAVRV